MLMGQPDPPRHVTTFLKKALDSTEDAKTLAGMAGPGFPGIQGNQSTTPLKRDDGDRVEP